MNVNDDFSKRVVMHADAIEWEDSPMPGVQRRRLDRVQGDTDRVTTIVRYAPNSQFSSHVHTGGEEFIVLDGVFEDDYGDWPVGSYIRNPPGSKHTPGSKTGCVIFVKLCQFDPDDRTFVHVNLNKLGSVAEANRPGVSSVPLYKDQHEDVRFEHWQPGTSVPMAVDKGAEVFVIEGGFQDGADELGKHSWLRIPAGGNLNAMAGSDGATVWIKQNHL